MQDTRTATHPCVENARHVVRAAMQVSAHRTGWSLLKLHATLLRSRGQAVMQFCAPTGPGRRHMHCHARGRTRPRGNTHHTHDMQPFLTNLRPPAAGKNGTTCLPSKGKHTQARVLASTHCCTARKCGCRAIQHQHQHQHMHTPAAGSVRLLLLLCGLHGAHAATGLKAALTYYQRPQTATVVL
jgi:hypothetical protein